MSNLHDRGPSLGEIQVWMAARILGPAASRELSDRVSALDAWVCAPASVSTADRIEIYQGGYPARVAEALAETYPALAGVVGGQAFDTLVNRYAAAIPLTSYNLNDAGAQMPAFLRRHPLAAERPFLPDLAELEWRVARAFHAVERGRLDPRLLGWSVDEWASAALVFQPAVAVVTSAWPLLELWSAGEPTRGAIDIELRDRPENVVVRRAGLTVRCESVSPSEARALRLLLDGQSLADALEWPGCDAASVFGWFSRWVSEGMIASASRRTS